MNRTSIILTSLCLALSACGKSEDPAAADALSKMHQRMQERIMVHAITIESPLIAKLSSTLALKIFPAAEISTGTTSVDLETALMSDATNPSDPLADLTVTLKASSEIPKVGAADSETVSLTTVINGRVASKALSMNIARADIVAPMYLPNPFVVPPTLTDRWYGTTFQEFDSAHEDNPPISEVLSSALRGIRTTPQQLETFLGNAHLWKGTGVLPDKDGLLQIKVETDKQKIRETVKALLTYIKEMSGSSFETQLRSNEGLKSVMKLLTKNDAEFMRTMGSAKGILSADKETYDFRGFSGDIFDEKNVKTALLDIQLDASGNLSISITDVKSKETFVLTKTGADVRIMAAGNEVLTGTLSSSAMNLTIKDPKTGAVTGSAASIFTITKKSFELSRGLFSYSPKQQSVTVDSLSVVLSDSLTDVSMKLKAVGTTNGKPLFTADFQASRTEASPLTLAKPFYFPLEDLQKDFLSALMPPALPAVE